MLTNMGNYMCITLKDVTLGCWILTPSVVILGYYHYYYLGVLAELGSLLT